MNISYNDFIRTTEARHESTVLKILEILYRKGDIYEDKYEGWYCTPCETFWMESQLVDGACPDCKRKVEKISETNYFFSLSKYQDWLMDYIKSHPDFIKPASRYEEVSRFLELNKLNDLCISRPKERLAWGIPFPFAPKHVTYVWFDALINYISAVGSFDEGGRYSSQWWAEDCRVVHMIGKDIIRQHAVYWPIMLHALGIRLPDTVFAHGWWLIDDTKMSKSRGNVVSPIEMVYKYGLDVYRYFLLRDVPFGLDGNFSEEAIIKRFNSDLANDLGNLVYRTLTMVEKYYQGVVPEPTKVVVNPQEKMIREMIDSGDLPGKVRLIMAGNLSDTGNNNYNFSAVLEDIWELINLANKYVEDIKPWNLAKENKTDELKAFIRLLVDVIREVAGYIYPFMPRISKAILDQIGQDRIKKGEPLFPRIDTKKTHA